MALRKYCLLHSKTNPITVNTKSINILFDSIKQILNITRSVIRFTNLISLILLVAHWNGCMQFLVPYIHDFPDDSWVVIHNLVVSDSRSSNPFTIIVTGCSGSSHRMRPGVISTVGLYSKLCRTCCALVMVAILHKTSPRLVWQSSAWWLVLLFMPCSSLFVLVFYNKWILLPDNSKKRLVRLINGFFLASSLIANFEWPSLSRPNIPSQVSRASPQPNPVMIEGHLMTLSDYSSVSRIFIWLMFLRSSKWKSTWLIEDFQWNWERNLLSIMNTDFKGRCLMKKRSWEKYQDHLDRYDD